MKSSFAFKRRLLALLLTLGILLGACSMPTTLPDEGDEGSNTSLQTLKESGTPEKKESSENSPSETKKDPEEEKNPETEKDPATKEGILGEENLSDSSPALASIPAYSGSPYVILNDNKPFFTAEEITSTAFESYASLDSKGRCGAALASCGKEIMPGAGEERGSISSIKPSGWVQAQYDCVSGKYLYNRCHLIGWQLSAENANKKNLITGTKYLNVEGMLPFENMVADYVKETGNHVMYRISPLFDGSELVARGVQMEAFSVEDGGEGICFNVFCYNVQPGVVIDYKTGESHLEKTAVQEETPAHTHSYVAATCTTAAKCACGAVQGSALGHAFSGGKCSRCGIADPSHETEQMVWIPKSGKKYHSKASCSNMKDPSHVTLSKAESLGFTPCSKCY